MLRTSVSLDSKLSRINLESSQASNQLMKKSVQLNQDVRSLLSIEHLKNRIKNISQKIDSIKAKNGKIQKTMPLQQNIQGQQIGQMDSYKVKQENSPQKNKNQTSYRSLIDRVNESILKSSKYGIKCKADNYLKQRTKLKINDSTDESNIPYQIVLNGQQMFNSAQMQQNASPNAKRSRSFKEKQMNMNLELIKKYSNSPKKRLSKKYSVNTNYQENSSLKIHKYSVNMELDQNRISNGFLLGKMLGRGKFGQVYLAEHIETGFIVAIKRVPKQKIVETHMVERFIGEIKLHMMLDHPNIVKFYGFFEEKEHICLVLQYLNGGTLFDCLNEVYTFPQVRAVKVLREVIDALDYLHEKNIIHRDIKPQNIVLSSTGIAKLCDFGWSTVSEVPRSTFCGTLQYASPEMLNRENYNSSVDVWCVGVLTYQMLIGRAPFESPDRKAVMQSIVNIGNSEIPNLRDVSLEARQFIEAILQADPSERPQIYELTQFALFKQHPQTSMLRSRSFTAN